MILIVKELYLLSAVTNMSHTCLKVSRAYAFLATKPSNTFSMAFEKVLEGLVKNGGGKPFEFTAACERINELLKVVIKKEG